VWPIIKDSKNDVRGITDATGTAEDDASSMNRRLRLALVALIALVASSCGGGSGLKAATRSLVPESSTIVADQTGDCVEFADEPSCADVYFTEPKRSQAERVELVRKAAADGDWEANGESPLPRATWLRYRRGSYRASVWILVDDRAAQCATRPRRSCSDLVHVIRD
jgi:hypothetical protein